MPLSTYPLNDENIDTKIAVDYCAIYISKKIFSHIFLDKIKMITFS